MNLFHDLGIAIIHQPQFPSQLVDALKWWFSIQIKSQTNMSKSYPSYRISWILKHQPETPLDLWFFDCSPRYPTPLVQTPKDGAWGASYQRSGFIPGSLLQKDCLPDETKLETHGAWLWLLLKLLLVPCCCSCCWMLVVVVGCWCFCSFCWSFLFNWKLPLRIILMILPYTVVMHHHVSLESLFTIIQFHWS